MTKWQPASEEELIKYEEASEWWNCCFFSKHSGSKIFWINSVRNNAIGKSKSYISVKGSDS